MTILSICTQSVFVQLQNCLFFSKGWGTGLQVGPTFSICSYFFLKMPYYPPFSTLKCHLLVKIQIQFFFPRSLRSLGLNKLTNDLFREHAAKHHFFLVLTPKGSLLSLYFCHSYYPAYLVWNLFLTTHCYKFVLGKALLFYTNNPYFFTTFPKFLSLLYTFFLLKGT